MEVSRVSVKLLGSGAKMSAFYTSIRSALRCIAKCAATARRKMSVIRQASQGETFRRMQQFVILQNMKWRTIDRGRFALAPSPEGPQNGGSAAFQRTRSADAPRLILIAHA